MTLRIQRSDENNRSVLTLIGRMQAEQLPQLETLLRAEADQNFVLDLRDVRLADRDAVRFLAQWESAGAGLRNCSAFIREWVSQERNEIRRAAAGRQQL